MPHVCQYKGEDHLCFFNGEQHQGFARGHGTIMDKSYTVVKEIDRSGAGTSGDMHEFRMTPHSNGTSVLMTVYQPRMFDLTTNPKYRIRNGAGWITEGVFQEVDIETGATLFEWRSTDHLDPSLSYTYPGTTDTSGDGLTEGSTWDYFHINSIDKNRDGDYLISARHMRALYKLSGKDGHIMWEMGGKNPTFEQTNFNFSYQHHARWLSENSTHTVISFFDNASNGFTRTNNFSHGYVVVINHIHNTATAIREWGCPEPAGGLLAGSQGSIQVLPSGNAFLGWGEFAHYSEHTWDGWPVMYAVVAPRSSFVMNYRAYKFNWTATPATKPALWTYALAPDAHNGMSMYVSWNGATEVAAWTFYTSQSAGGPFQAAASVAKNDFETRYIHPEVNGWAFAEALDSQGRPLARSEVSKTFIPSMNLRQFCNDDGCAEAKKDETFNPEVDYAPEPEWELLTPNRGYNTTNYYPDMPGSELSLLHPGGGIDWASLVLGMALALMLGSGSFTAYMFIKRNFPAGSPLGAQLHDTVAVIKDNWSKSSVGSQVGNYMRVHEMEEKDLPP